MPAHRWEVILTTEMEAWSLTLDDDSFEALASVIELLEEQGPALRRPVVGQITSSRHSNMKELIPPSSTKSKNMRVLFAFDPKRQALLLIGGDKTGNWAEWYKANIPRADKLFDEYLLEGEGT